MGRRGADQGGWYTDRDRLREQYDDAERLAVRIRTHARYRVGSRALSARVLELLDARDGELVADVACGPGAIYHPPLRALGARVLGVDLSAGMVREAAGGCWAAVRADAQALPLAGGSCDKVMCNHALYHVPDQVRALRELRRVTRPGGRVLLTTNSRRTMHQLREVTRRAAADLGRPPDPAPVLPFALEDVCTVRGVFPEASVAEFGDVLAFPTARPVVEYVASGRAIDVPFAEALARRVQQVIDAEGAFRVETIAGCFVADVGPRGR